MSPRLRHLAVRVWRQEPVARGGFTTYAVDAPIEGMVIDALFAIQRSEDSSLAFRVSCRAGICGSCAVRVDGRERLACQTPLSILRDRFSVQPLRHLPVLRDLVCDLDPFFERYGRVHPEFRPGPEPGRPVPATPAERAVVDRLINCISCGACHSACDEVGLNPAFIGPAGLARALALAADRRDRDPQARLSVATGKDGVWRCHSIGSCNIVCPKAVAPALAIHVLRRGGEWRS